MENIQGIEQSREKYKDFREMLSDSHLSDEEKAELQESYEYECDATQEEAHDMCHELQKEIEAYNDMQNMSREQIEKLQILSGIPKNQIDGIRWPNTFAYYSTSRFSDLLPREVSQKYEEVFSNFENIFESLDIEERKVVQRQVWAHDDGIFWPNTFQKICEHLQKNTEIESIFLKDTQSEVWEEAWSEEISEVQEPEEEIPLEIEEEEYEFSGEQAEISPEELKEVLIKESEGTHRVLIKMLQRQVWATDDGAFGANSAQKAIDVYPDITSFEELMQVAWIPLESDGLLEWGANMEIWQESFREQYWEFVSILESNFELPAGIIEAIIAQETKYGAWKLTSPTWCKWMMQLSNNAFDDMDTAHRWNIRNYRESFRNMDIDRLLAVAIDDGTRTIWESIPSPIISELRVLKNPDTSNAEYNRAINTIQEFIKWDSTYFNHAVNMIIGAVYLSGTYHDSRTWWQDITKTADHYNAAAWERETYRSNVTWFYEEIRRDGYYDRYSS